MITFFLGFFLNDKINISCKCLSEQSCFFLFFLAHSLIHHFETVPNSKKLQTTTEMFKDTDCIEKNSVEKGEIAHFEQFHPFPQCFP